MSVNNKKKQLGCIINFLKLKFDTLHIEAQLPKNKLKKAIKNIKRILERRSFTTNKNCFLFAAKVVY